MNETTAKAGLEGAVAQQDDDAGAKKADSVEQRDFANPTLNIIQSFSRTASTSDASVASREGTPPPLPPRPTTAHSTVPPRPPLVSKATTQVSFANSQHTSVDLGRNVASRTPSDADDGASIRSYMPAADTGADAESILGDVLGAQEKSAHEKKLLLRTLGHYLGDADAENLFPPDPELEAAFDTEFDDVDDMQPDGSNEGQECDGRL